MRLTTVSSVSLALLLAAAPARGQAVSTPGAAPIAWIAGCWEQRTATRVVQEHWMAPAGGALLGVSRTLRGERGRETMVEFEFVRIVARDGRWVYIAQPSGRPPTEFVSESVSDSLIVFTNPAHDFPQRITYRAVGTDSLVARVEAPAAGGGRGIDFRYARTSCG